MTNRAFPIARNPWRMWVVWLSYLFQFAAVGIYYTFINVYLRSTGLSGTQIGVLNMLAAIAGMAGSLAWGYLGDRTGKPRFIISGGAAGALLVVQFFPSANGFWPLLVIICLASLMNSAPMTLVDSTTLALLGPHRDDYGRYRLGGSIGYVVMIFASGFIFQATGLQVMFPLYGAVMVLFSLTALWLPQATIHLELPHLKQIADMAHQSSWLIFISCFFLAWISYNAAIMFLSVSLDALGASKSLIGVATIIPAIVEIPFMFFSGAFLRRFGPVRLMAVAMGLMAVRYFLLSQMPSPIWAVAINVLNGPAYVLFWNSAVTYTNKMAPAHMAGTAQGLLTAATGLASVVGSLLVGWLFDVLGPKGIFLVLCALVLAALLLFSTGSLLRKPPSQPALPVS